MKITKMLKGGILALAALTIFAGCSLFGAKPSKEAQDAVHTAMINSSNVKAGTYDITFSGKVTPGKESKAQFKELNGSLNFGGVYDTKVKNDPKFSFKADIKGSVDGGKEQSVSGEMRLVQKNAYFSIGKLEVEAIPALYQAAIAQFLNKWWYVALPPESFANLSTGDEKDMTPEQKQMKALIEKTQFFKNVSDKGADKVGAVDAEKYSIELDKDAFRVYLTEAAKISVGSKSADMAGVNKFMKDVEFKGNVWVGKADQTMVKIDGTVSLVPSADNDNNSGSFKITYTTVNGDVKLDVPAGAELFDIAKIMGGASAKATSALEKAEDIKAKKDATEKALNAK